MDKKSMVERKEMGRDFPVAGRSRDGIAYPWSHMSYFEVQKVWKGHI